MKNLIFFASVLLATQIKAAPASLPTHLQIYADVLYSLAGPATVQICVEDDCKTYEMNPIGYQTMDAEEGGEPTYHGPDANKPTMRPSRNNEGGGDWGKTVGDIVDKVTGHVGAGGHVGVTYTHSATTNKDGSKTEKTEVKVDVNGGTGEAGNTAAGK